MIIDKIIIDIIKSHAESLESIRKSLDSEIDYLTADKQIHDISGRMESILQDIINSPVGSTGIEGKFQNLIKLTTKLQGLKLIAARRYDHEYVMEVRKKHCEVAKIQLAIRIFLDMVGQK